MSLMERLRALDRAAFPDLLVRGLDAELAGVATALDLGCGAGGPVLKARKPAHLTGLDGHAPSLERLKAKGHYDELILRPVTEADFSEGQFEAVLAMDLIEHFEKPQALEMLARMESWASRKVILATPNGFLPQGEYDENPFQVHRCGFSASELKALGYRVHGYGGWRPLRGPYAELRFRPRPLWHRLSGLTQPFTWALPSLAFGLLAVKEK